MRHLPLFLWLLSACAPAHVDVAERGFRRVDVETFRAEREAGAFQAVLDVRTPEEYRAGHVPGAVNVPIDALKARLPELSGLADAKVAVICEVGGRSLAASETLTPAGFHGVVDVEGGTRAWRGQNNPVTQGDAP